MPRARNPDSIKAEELYRNGASLVAIAEQLGVSPGTVRSWKNRQQWDGEPEPKKEQKKRNVAKKKPTKKAKKKTEKKSATLQKKRGAPPGNKNAAGATPSKRRNQSATKHGAYSAVFFNFLSDEDKELVEAMAEVDVEGHLLLEIRTLTIRERRVLKAIEEQKKKKNRLYVAAVYKTDVKRSFEGKEEEQAYQKEAYEEYRADHNMAPGFQSEITTKTESTIDLISRLDRELTSIQKQITADLKLLEEVRQTRIENARAEELLPLQKERIDAEIERLDAQTSKILGTNLELEDTTEADDLLYGSGMEVIEDAPEAPDPEE